ncbi:uncharacterized protein AB9W97_013989 [Spinachia spinachia]
MYMNLSGAENGSYSLTFLGKKVGRHHSVAPAGKQNAWETTDRSNCPEGPVSSSRPVRAPVTAQVLQDLPGCIPELKDKSAIVDDAQLDEHTNSTAGVFEKKVAA